MQIGHQLRLAAMGGDQIVVHIAGMGGGIADARKTFDPGEGTDQARKIPAAALGGSMNHLYREENGALADGLPRLTPDQRRMLGRQWSELTASWMPGSAPVSLS